MDNQHQATGSITVSDSAAARIGQILAEEAPGTMFRLAVSGGGCSGFQYNFELTTVRSDDDIAIDKHGVVVLVDAMSMMYLEGAELDYADELIGAAFRVNNPNATASCGCGTSFSI
jgi:iron-sulfur cluster assembly accessory protein